MQTEFAKILATRLLQSKGRNPSYSLRSFAKQIGISHSAVSEILSGKRRLSLKKMIHIAHRLGLSESQIKDFDQKSPTEKRRNTTQIDLDQFSMISGSVPFAILSLMETESFHSDISWMAKRLGVSKRVVVDSLKRLERLEMVSRDADGLYVCTGKSFSTPEFIAGEAMKYHHEQNLLIAKEALNHREIDERYFSSITMTIDPRKLQEAKEMLRNFRDQFCITMEDQPKKEVYRLVLQFFPLTHPDSEDSQCTH